MSDDEVSIEDVHLDEVVEVLSFGGSGDTEWREGNSEDPPDVTSAGLPEAHRQMP